MLILLACFCGLRWGELAGLRRGDIDIEHRTVRVVRQLCEVPGRPPFFAAPKSDAGRRMVAIPSMIPRASSIARQVIVLDHAKATLRELMDRMGHSTSRAALIYLHSTSDR